MTKTGSGTWSLNGASTYTGATTISQGSLIVNGSIAAGSPVSLLSGSLSGTGTVAGAITVTSGTVSPGVGNTPGTLTVGSLSLGGNVLAIDLNGSSNDQLVATGTVNIAGATLSLNINGFSAATAVSILHSSGLTGTFAGFADGSTIVVNGQTVLVHYTSTDVMVTVGVPLFTSGTATMFALGTAGTFTVSAIGSPTPTINLTSGTLPTGVSRAASSAAPRRQAPAAARIR